MSSSTTLVQVIAICFFAASCITPSEKKGMKDDIFGMQTRLLQLEKQLDERQKDQTEKGESANKRIASTYSDLEKIRVEMREMKGSMDALRMGVITGQMPGAENSQGSVASALTDLAARMDALEASQKDILDAIRKAGVKRTSSARKGATTLKALQAAYDGEKYKDVVEDAPKVLKSVTGDEKAEVMALQAESLFKLGRMRDAALKFNEILESSKDPAHLRHGKMRMGDCLKSLGEVETAKIYYEEVITEYPESEEARESKRRMAELGSGSSRQG